MYCKLLLHSIESVPPPEITSRPQNQTVIVNTEATFTCEAHSVYKYDIMWRFNGSIVLSTNDTADTAKYSINRDRSIPLQFGSLTVSNVQYSDRGVYQCSAISDAGNASASATLDLTVCGEQNLSDMTARLYFLHTVPPSILSLSAPVSKVINSSASLFCSVRGYPLTTISWLKDGLLVATDSTITITTQSATSVSPGYLQQLNATFTRDVGVISVLQFSSLQRKDNGMYVCQAMNTFNQTVTFTVATNAISIIVFGNYYFFMNVAMLLSVSAEVPSAPGVSSISYTAVSVYLAWSVPSFIGNSAVLGYKVYSVLWTV